MVKQDKNTEEHYFFAEVLCSYLYILMVGSRAKLN